MPNTFDASLCERDTPWEACAALELFFRNGGSCTVPSETNWIYIAFYCESRADGDGTLPPLHHALAWSYMAIAVHESMATGLSAEHSFGMIKATMWVRMKMILRCGDQPGDNICDLSKLVDWCLSTPTVQQFMLVDPELRFGLLDPEVREIADILKALKAAALTDKHGDVVRFLDRIEVARARN